MSKEHDENCLCSDCIGNALEQLREMGYLQKLLNTRTGEVAWLNAELPCPPDFIPYTEN